MSGSKLWKRVLNTIAPATISQIDDTGPVLRVQVTIGRLEVNDDVAVPQQFGFASVPPLGSDITLQFVAGDRSNGAGVGTNHQPTRFRNKASGETVVFNAFGMSIYLSQAGIVINSGGLPVVLEGALHVTGPVIAGFGTASQVSLETHQHGVGTAAAGTVPPTPGT